MAAANLNVKPLNTVNKQIPEVKSLMEAVSKVSWDLRVPLISQTLGLGYSIDSKLLNKDLDLPRGSVGRQMGFTKLGEVISSPESAGGLNIPWSDWISDLKAYGYKKNFGIYYKSRQEVLKEYSAVCDALGHNPVTLHEFSKARDEIMLRNNHMREKEISEKADKIRESYELEKAEKRKVEQKYDDVSNALDSLQEKHKELEEEYRNEINVLKSANELHVQQVREKAFEEASSKYRPRLTKLKREIKGLEGELADALKKIASMDIQSEESKKMISNLKDQIKHKSRELKAAEDVIARQEDVIARNEKMIDELESRIEDISSQNGIAQMEMMLDKSRDRLIRLGAKYRAAADAKSEFKARISKNRQRISILKSELRERKLEIRKKEAEIKRKNESISNYRMIRNALSIMTISSLGLITAFAYLMM